MSGTTLQAQKLTRKQRRDICRLLTDSLDEISLGKVQGQRLLGKGGELKDAVKALITRLTAPDLLEPVATVELPAVDTFLANDHFRVGDEVDGVKIGWLGSNFRHAFLGKTETCVASATLRVQRLLKASLAAPIIAELGGEAVAETPLAQM